MSSDNKEQIDNLVESIRFYHRTIEEYQNHMDALVFELGNLDDTKTVLLLQELGDT